MATSSVSYSYVSLLFPSVSFSSSLSFIFSLFPSFRCLLVIFRSSSPLSYSSFLLLSLIILFPSFIIFSPFLSHLFTFLFYIPSSFLFLFLVSFSSIPPLRLLFLLFRLPFLSISSFCLSFTFSSRSPSLFIFLSVFSVYNLYSFPCPFPLYLPPFFLFPISFFFFSFYFIFLLLIVYSFPL